MAINPHRKGGPDVPVVDGGTGASDGASALTSLGHATTDHTGIPGVGGGTNSGVTALDSSATEVEINAALADPNTGIVLLLPGTYTISGTINMVAGKTLMGSGGSCDWDGNASVTLNVNVGGGTVINMSTRTKVLNFGINLAGAAGVVLAGNNGSGQYAEGIGFRASGQNFQQVIQWRLGGNYSIRHCVFVGSGQSGTGTGTSGKSMIFMQPIGNESPSVIEHCYVRQGSDVGYETYGYTKIYNCTAESQGGDGFYTQAPDYLAVVSDCVANGNSGDGFNVSNTASGDHVFTIRDCMSRGNGGYGYSGSGGGINGMSIHSGCRARANATGVSNFVGFWSNPGGLFTL